ncbi:MAG: dihydroneopterin aldolase [Fibrobacter sp.]|jgi:FolB domain-containing protein|nr:dihydroneopterin aldolase [Fibrobacter sp.]
MRVKKSFATVHISNLSLETTIGWNTWEQQQKQNIIINITFDFDQTAAVESDELNDTVDYRALKNRIRREVESTSFKLLEKLADHILGVVMSDERVVSATVKIDKPHALSQADSVSVKISAERER